MTSKRKPAGGSLVRMELYRRWLEQNEKQPGEESPLGLILCAGKSDEHVELLRLDETGIRAAGARLEPRAEEHS